MKAQNSPLFLHRLTRPQLGFMPALRLVAMWFLSARDAASKAKAALIITAQHDQTPLPMLPAPEASCFKGHDAHQIWLAA